MLNLRPRRAEDPRVIDPTRRPRDERGFTIIEVMVAATILVVGVLGTLTLLDSANRATQRTKAREGATNLAREIIEAARAVGYPNLTPSQIESELQAQPALGDSAPSVVGWNITRRNVRYTVSADVCSVDDGTITADGYGNHTGGFFCADSATEGSADANPDDYKRVAIDVTWKDGSKTLTARQEAVINNPGSAFAPAIKSLVPSTGSATSNPPITSPSMTSVVFTATTTSKPEGVRWALDNVAAGTAGGSQTTWTFTWQIPNATQPNTVVDGTYLVSAEAFDQYGQTGTGRTLTMVVNRYAPTKPTGLAGGRNALWGGNFAEFEWYPNPERDILGYRVYRVEGSLPASTDPLVCETTIDDASPTACGASGQPAGDHRYYVRAFAPARSGSGTEESDLPALSDTLLVTDNVRPDAPTNVGEDLVVDDGGTVTLTWDVPTDPDGTIRYYRIYRDDNTVYTKRYGGTGSGAQNAWTDRDGVPGQHRYWVTAVDDHLAESDFAPPVGFVP
jgi:prepilin-type N-terminal cleavage/methylation domain-containing protein